MTPELSLLGGLVSRYHYADKKAKTFETGSYLAGRYEGIAYTAYCYALTVAEMFELEDYLTEILKEEDN